MEISEARKNLTHLNLTEPIIVTKHNKPVLVIMNYEVYESIQETLEILSDPEALRMFQQSIQDIQQGRTHAHEDVTNDYGFDSHLR